MSFNTTEQQKEFIQAFNKAQCSLEAWKVSQHEVNSAQTHEMNAKEAYKKAKEEFDKVMERCALPSV